MGTSINCCYQRKQILNLQRLQSLDENILQQVKELREKHIQQLDNAKVYGFGEVTFIGQINNKDKKIGYGQMYHKNNILLCVFQNDLPNGYGIIIKNYQQYFKGEFKNGLYHGKGRQHSQKHSYEGDYENGSRKKGLLKTQQFIYHGQFKNNIFCGQGQLIIKCGVVYQGNFLNGKYEGHGTITYPNNNRYEGEFSQGNYDGKGKFQWADGTRVIGFYKKGKRLEGAKFQHINQTKIDSSRTIGEQNYLKNNKKSSLFEVDQQKFKKVSKIIRGNGILQLY